MLALFADIRKSPVYSHHTKYPQLLNMFRIESSVNDNSRFCFILHEVLPNSISDFGNSSSTAGFFSVVFTVFYLRQKRIARTVKRTRAEVQLFRVVVGSRLSQPTKWGTPSQFYCWLRTLRQRDGWPTQSCRAQTQIVLDVFIRVVQ